MKNSIIIGLFCIFLFSCKKKKESDSSYLSADIRWGVMKYIDRDSMEIDSIEYYVDGFAFFDPFPSDKVVGGVFINCDQFDGPIIEPQHTNAQYTFTGRVFEADVTKYNNIELVVKSPNGFTDFAFNTNNIPFYKDSIPYLVSKNSDLVLPIDASNFSTADSIGIYITGYNKGWDTTFKITTASVTIHSTILQSLFSLATPSKGIVSIAGIKHYSIYNLGKTFNLHISSGVSYQIYGY